MSTFWTQNFDFLTSKFRVSKNQKCWVSILKISSLKTQNFEFLTSNIDFLTSKFQLSYLKISKFDFLSEKFRVRKFETALRSTVADDLGARSTGTYCSNLPKNKFPTPGKALSVKFPTLWAQKETNSRGLPGGMLKFRFDWRIRSYISYIAS